MIILLSDFVMDIHVICSTADLVVENKPPYLQNGSPETGLLLGHASDPYSKSRHMTLKWLTKIIRKLPFMDRSFAERPDATA